MHALAAREDTPKVTGPIFLGIAAPLIGVVAGAVTGGMMRGFDAPMRLSPVGAGVGGVLATVVASIAVRKNPYWWVTPTTGAAVTGAGTFAAHALKKQGA